MVPQNLWLRMRLPLAASLFTLGLVAVEHDAVGQTSDAKPRSLSDPLTEEELETPLDNYVSPEQIVREAFGPPPKAKALSKKNVWIDRDKKRVYLDGYVAMREGPLEMFACPMGTKEHESIVGSLAPAHDVHAALLAIGARSGTPVQFLPNFVPATGQRIRVWVCYRTSDDKYHAVDARTWIRKAGTTEQMEADWVFAGSGFWKDESDGREYYRADGGDMICVSNFNTAMMDVTMASSQEAEQLVFTPFADRIPERGTPVRLVLVPIPIPTDAAANAQQNGESNKVDVDKAPKEGILPKADKPDASTSSDATD